MKKRLLTAADLSADPPASIDLDSCILTPSARMTAERLGIPLHRGGQPLDPRLAGSSKTGGAGAGDYTLVRPQFTPSGQVPRFGNPTHATLEPLHGSKAWKTEHGPELDRIRQLVKDRFGPTASAQAIERGVSQIMERLPSASTTSAPDRRLNDPLAPGGASPFAPALPGGVPTTTPMILSGEGAVTYRGNSGEIHIILPPTTKTYLIRVAHGNAKVSEVLE